MQARSCSLFRALNHRCDVCSWHLTDKPPAPEFVAYWTNNGQKAVLGLDLSAAIDPKRTSGGAELFAKSVHHARRSTQFTGNVN
jgi:hypothetical protein